MSSLLKKILSTCTICIQLTSIERHLWNHNLRTMDRMLRSLLILFVLILMSCSYQRQGRKVLAVHDLELELADESLLEQKLSSLGIIDITALIKQRTIDQLHLKLARNIDAKNADVISIVLLDKNGNGSHNDFGEDMIALAPNNWNKINAFRFDRLNFSPIQENQTLLIRDHYMTISELGELEVKITPSQATNDYITFPYSIPQITRNSIHGEKQNFQELTGQGKLIYIEFWGTWCKPCVAQIPDIKKLQNKYNDQLIIIGISSNDELSKLRDYTQRATMEWPQIQMDEEISKSFGGVFAFPLGVLFDDGGKLIKYDITPKEILSVLDKK